jgi:hypothetical protein
MRKAATNVRVFQCPCGTLATRGTPVVADHLRRDRSLVDEDETWRIELGLFSFEGSALGSNVRTILLGGA